MTYKILNSLLTVNSLIQATDYFTAVRIYGNRLYYTKSISDEQGRVSILSCNFDGTDLVNHLPSPYTVKSRINVYGGLCLCVTLYGIVFADGDSKTLCLINNNGDVLTLLGSKANYGDVAYCGKSDSLIYVVESLTHTANQHIECYHFNTERTQTITKGADFYHCPQIYGRAYAWLQWNKDTMPWDNASIIEQIDGTDTIIGTGAGYFQPRYDKHGVLHYSSDYSGYFNIYKQTENKTKLQNLSPLDIDFAYPLWIYGMRSYDFMDDGIIACGVQNGKWQVGIINDETFALHNTDAVTIESITADATTYAYIAGYTNKLPEIICVVNGHTHIIDSAGQCPLPVNHISIGKSITYAGKSGEVQAYYYPPTHPDYDNSPPPLIVKSHGGPTGQTDNSYSNKIQFWTSRGFAVLDVNYSGSTGFGTDYRNRLKGRWGELDVSDLECGALHLVEQGLVDKDRLIISGSSAGGFSVLSALTFGSVFNAGCSIYGISDLVGLAEETHKFEEKYFDVLIAPYPECKGDYINRSPINHIRKLTVPVLFLQGLDDVVVSPTQSQVMYDALINNGIDTALILFKGEGHGFKNAKTVATALSAELDFYVKVLDLETPAFTGNIEVTLPNNVNQESSLNSFLLELNTVKILDFSKKH